MAAEITEAGKLNALESTTGLEPAPSPDPYRNTSSQYDGATVRMGLESHRGPGGAEQSLAARCDLMQSPPWCLFHGPCSDLHLGKSSSAATFTYNASSGHFTRTGTGLGMGLEQRLHVGETIPMEGSSVISFRCGFCACELPVQQWDVLANGTIAFRFGGMGKFSQHHTGTNAKRLVLGAGPNRCLCWCGIKSSTILVYAGDPRQLVFTELIDGRRAVNSVASSSSRVTSGLVCPGSTVLPVTAQPTINQPRIVS